MMEHKDAIACDIPEDHPIMEKSMKQKLPVTEVFTFSDFYSEVDKVKNKGQMIHLLVEYMQKGERRGFLNADKYPDQMKKIREMAG